MHKSVMADGSIYLWGEDGQGYKGAEEAQADPVGGKLPDPKVQDDEVQLFLHGQAGGPDVDRCLAPELHRAAGPTMLLLAVREEARGKLHRSEDTIIKAAEQAICESLLYIPFLLNSCASGLHAKPGRVGGLDSPWLLPMLA